MLRLICYRWLTKHTSGGGGSDNLSLQPSTLSTNDGSVRGPTTFQSPFHYVRSKLTLFRHREIENELPSIKTVNLYMQSVNNKENIFKEKLVLRVGFEPTTATL
jgi:hypothetical protein